MNFEETVAHWEECIDIRERDGKFYGLMRMMFTVGIACDLREGTYAGRFCFDTLQNAKGFYNEWDFKTRPVVGVDGCTADKAFKWGNYSERQINR